MYSKASESPGRLQLVPLIVSLWRCWASHPASSNASRWVSNGWPWRAGETRGEPIFMGGHLTSTLMRWLSVSLLVSKMSCM